MKKVIVLLIGVLLICSLAGAERAESRGTSTWFLSYNTKEKADQLIADYERAGLNTVYAMVWWYRAFYPTDRFPTDPRLDPDFDAVAYLLEECHRRGWSFYAWFVNARVHPRLTQNYDRFGDWLIVNEEGQRDEQRLDYNLPEVREYEKELILDFLARYPRVDGFQFDYIRFPWQGGYSYSDRARELFAAEHGYDVRALAGRPESWAEPERKSKEWRQWQRDNIRKLIEAVYTGAKAINPDILVGAAVMGREDWAEQADQPWWEWVEDGLFEFVKTMYYENDEARYREYAEFWRRVVSSDAHDRISFPVGASEAWHRGDHSVVSDRVLQARESGARKIFFFRYGTMDEKLLAHLGDGVFRDRVPPHRPESRTDARLRFGEPRP